jgi:hypothetical protein
MIEKYFQDRDGRNFYGELGGLERDDLREIYMEFEEENLVPEQEIGSVRNFVSESLSLGYHDSENKSGIILDRYGILKILGDSDEDIQATRDSFDRVSQCSYTEKEVGVVA